MSNENDIDISLESTETNVNIETVNFTIDIEDTPDYVVELNEQGPEGQQGPRGIQGETGNGIQSVTKTSTQGNIDTYTIAFTDGSTTNFNVTNGTSISTITKTSTSGLVDTYTITLTNGSTTTFQVTNGAKGDKGDTGNSGVQISTTEPTDPEIKVWINPEGEQGKTSQLENDGDGTSPFATETLVQNYHDTTKQDVIENLSEIESNASAGKSASDTIATYGNIVTHNTSEFLLATTKYGSSLTMSLDDTTYILTTTLKDQDGNTLGTPQTIDLPLESVVVSGRYDKTTKEVILTLKDGSEIKFSVADLVSGLQTEITATNKLSSDLVDDTGHTNKFVTESDKTNWNGKVTANTSITASTTKQLVTYDSKGLVTGGSTLASSDVTGALGYTPYNSTNPNNYISGITSTMVTNALGYTPYNSTNPNGYITKAVDDTSTTSTTLGWSASKLNSTIGDIETLLQGLR